VVSLQPVQQASLALSQQQEASPQLAQRAQQEALAPQAWKE
jgi:hypothetical protein